MGVKRKRKAGRCTKAEPKPPVVSLVSSSDASDGDVGSNQGDRGNNGHESRNADDDDADAAKAVLEILMGQGLPLTEERARLLIDTTREQHESQRDIDAWADACMLAMAIDNEIEDEAADVRVAMADSLREAEAAQPSTSLDREPLEVILQHYMDVFDSQVAAHLVEADRSALLERGQLMSLLDLEARCAKWYGASARAYFEELLDAVREIEDATEVGRVLVGALDDIREAVLVRGRDDFFSAYKTVEDVVTIL